MEDSKRPRHPPHLKGKEIGLYYARLNKNRNRKDDNAINKYQFVKSRHLARLDQRSTVTVDSQKERAIIDLLHETQYEESSLPSRPSSFSYQYQNHLAYSRTKENAAYEDVAAEHRLQNDPSLDELLCKELRAKKNQYEVQSMLEFRKKLPAYQMRKEIVEAVEKNQVIVISGETGCGKTTQVPQFILDSYIESNMGSVCKVICTQPRRISAISMAERVAKERGETCVSFASVGWQIRLENKLPRARGSILYCTTGIMLKNLQHNRHLSEVSHMILDEIHERDLDTDFLLIILKNILTLRPELKLILMSATLNAEQFSHYFGGCPMIHIPGFTHPVKEYFLEDVLEMTRYDPVPKMFPSKRKYRKKAELESNEELEVYLNSLMGKYSHKTINTLRNWDEKIIDLDLTVELLSYICQYQPDGAVLVFLPGWVQISDMHKRLSSDRLFTSSRFLILPLHSMMPTMNQKEIFEKPPEGVRKIIIATNIAETSITIDDVVYVIDCGKIKMSNFDEKNHVTTLQPEWVALSNAHQRRGRAGRVQPGVCYHLYSKYREARLQEYQLPEMLRTRLENLILKIKILKLGKAAQFLEKALNPPSPEVVNLSLNLLRSLNALDDNEYLTPLGFHLARLPMDPLTGRMILFGAMFSCLEPILTVAASLSFKDAFLVPLGKERIVDEKRKELASGFRSDHLMLARALMEWERLPNDYMRRNYCWDNFLSTQTLNMLVKMREQLAEYLADLKFLHCSNSKHPDFNINSGNWRLLKAVVCAGLYPNVAKLKQKHFKGSRRPVLITKDDTKSVYIHPKSVNASERNFQYEWLVFYQKVKSENINLHDTTEVHPYSLLLFGGKITTELDQNFETVVIDGWIRFHCKQKTAELIMNLRERLDSVLEHKINNPGVLSTDPKSHEGAVLHSIIELITSEDSYS